VEIPHLWRDESYGRSPYGGDWGVFMESTPGLANNTESRPGFAPMPTLSPQPGYQPLATTITSSVEGVAATLRMTTDGSAPDGLSSLWNDFDIQSDSTVVRVRAYVDGLWPSRIATGTYLVRTPPDVGVVSLVIDPMEFSDVDEGMYVFGDVYDSDYPYFGANFWEDWERDVHFELFDSDATTSVAGNAGIVIHGGWSRALDQRSLRLTVRAGYGLSALEYPVFGDGQVDRFKRLILRNSGNDWHGCGFSGCSPGSHVRDAFVHRMIADVDVDKLADRPVLTYINGEPWGMYNLRERGDKYWIAEAHGVDEVDILEWDGVEVEGDSTHWVETISNLRDADRSDPQTYEWLLTRVDLGEYANYQITQIYIDNTDWPGNNLKWWRPATDDGRWRWLLYDTDFGIGMWGGSPADDTLAFALESNGPEWPNPPWSTEFFRLCMDMPQFQEDFANRYADLLNTAFDPQEAVAVLTSVVDERESAMEEHLDRWGAWGSSSMGNDAWKNEIDWMKSWLNARPEYAWDHLLDHLELSGTWNLQLDVEPEGAGYFELTAVSVGAPFDGDYFLGVPVTVSAVAYPGWSFVGWEQPGLIGADATIEVNGGAMGSQLTALFE